VGIYLAGLCVALIPAAISCFNAPAQFYFGNFTYPTLNTAARITSGYQKSMTPLGKLVYVFTEILAQPPTLVLMLLLAVTLYLRRRFATRICLRFNEEIYFLLVVSCAVLSASLAPTPLFSMYFYTPLVLLMLMLLLLAAPLLDHPIAGRTWLAALVASVLFTVITQAPEYHVSKLPATNEWLTLRVHRVGHQVRLAAGSRATILTFSPIFPLEGGEEVMERLATGPFASRVAGMVSRQDAARYCLVGADDFLKLFRSRPRVAVLTGREASMDDELIARLSTSGHLQPHAIPTGLTLWTATVHERGEVAR
jgi:hypothetical protein